MTDKLTPVSHEITRIGWIGTGVMGLSMCGHLLDAGFKVSVFTRTKSKAKALLDKGAVWAESPMAVAHNSDVVFSIVGFPPDVREVYFGEQGVLRGLKSGAVSVDMTTTSPSLAVEIADAARGQGAFALDAPVSGGDVGARNAKLSIMVGGDDAVFQAVLPLFRLMGGNIVHQGQAGAGQHAKMCNQIVIAGTMIGVCESMVYAAAAGLDPTKVLESITKGAAYCWSLENLAPRILKGDFAPGFMIDHFIKDMGIALEEARRMGIRLPGLDLVERIYKEASALGHGRDGTQALYQALRKMSIG
ncbi:3-hydroxyisobutyrate dehydrogenase [Desulfonatronum thiosulfatophilum]|uniref:3-hydroxyisobutyrate dehydrogenase n=1 Tax=Desulfonatronum thiosulfatophilum TaxID=617002 RepID=A0A1G6DPQ6_9BACT|nr:NAD(P)-dependent oxidoreductase [Desulfonatronum thiosulfatophilum]SDB46765.1 3-hydroxyisobutyrate dehydrogenase [Desulfonatronum thiosulfatophilum]